MLLPLKLNISHCIIITVKLSNKGLVVVNGSVLVLVFFVGFIDGKKRSAMVGFKILCIFVC